MKSIKIACKTGTTVPLSKLNHLQGELKNLSDDNYEKLKTEILGTGFAFAPHCWIDKKKKHWLVDGHMRAATLRRLEADGYEVPPIPIVPVQAASIQEAKRRVLQATSQYGHMTEDSLVKFMNEAGLNLDFLNDKFDLPNIDMDSLTRDFIQHEGKIVSVSEHQRTIGLTDDDAVPEVKKSRVKLGDIWKLGDHRLMCGDSTDKATVEKLMNGEKADMVFTDPPYNHASDEKLVSQSVSQAMKKLANSDWDKNFDFNKTFDVIDAVRAENFSVYICTSWHLAGSIWAWMKEKHSSHYSYCVWHKTNPMPSLMKRHWTWASELICYATWGKHTFNFPKEGHASSVWSIQKNLVNDLHPTMKPVEIPEKAISHSSKAGQSVLDLFGGSGSTLIACEKTRRRCFMLELDPHYCTVILDRWEAFTGRKAERVVAPKLLKRPSSDKRRTISVT